MGGARATAAVAIAGLLGLVALAGRPAGALPRSTTGPGEVVAAGTPGAISTGLEPGTAVESRDPTLVGLTLTTEASDRYLLDREADTITVAAPTTNLGQNTRAVFARVDEHQAVDQQACITWSAQSSWIDQQGVALRIRAGAGGEPSAITVTKNVWFAANWIFNVHVWNPGTVPEYSLIGQFDLSAGFRSGTTVASLPWRICARADNSVVSFSVWPLTRSRPAWTDARYGGAVALPPGYEEPGAAGGYIGHLRPGDSVSFSALETVVFDAGRLWAPGAPSVRQPMMIESAA